MATCICPQCQRPRLILDSGASIHTVSDPKLLCNLRDVPAGMTVVAVDGNALPVTKIGDMNLPAAAGGFTIPDVYLVPGLKLGSDEDGLISVRQLARQSGVCTRFDADRAVLFKGKLLVGVAVGQEDFAAGGIYVLKFLRTVSDGVWLRGPVKLVWCARDPRPELSYYFMWRQRLSRIRGLVAAGSASLLKMPRLFGSAPCEKPEEQPRPSCKMPRRVGPDLSVEETDQLQPPPCKMPRLFGPAAPSVRGAGGATGAGVALSMFLL